MNEKGKGDGGRENLSRISPQVGEGRDEGPSTRTDPGVIVGRVTYSSDPLLRTERPGSRRPVWTSREGELCSESEPESG